MTGCILKESSPVSTQHLCVYVSTIKGLKTLNFVLRIHQTLNKIKWDESVAVSVIVW